LADYGNFEIILEFGKDIYAQDHFFALSSSAYIFLFILIYYAFCRTGVTCYYISSIIVIICCCLSLLINWLLHM